MRHRIRLTLALAFAAALALIGACGDDDGPTSDGGADTAAEAGGDGLTPDTTSGDLGPAGSNKCKAILACIDSNCVLTAKDYQVCVSGCRISGTHAAQKLFDAYTTCADATVKGACAGDCDGSTPSACATCLRRECITQFLACDEDK